MTPGTPGTPPSLQEQSAMTRDTPCTPPSLQEQSAQCLRVHLAPRPTYRIRELNASGIPGTPSVSFSQLLMLFWPAKSLGRRDGKKVEGEERTLRNVNSLRGEQQGSSMVREHLSVILGLGEECRCLGRMRERIFRLGDGRTSWTRDTMKSVNNFTLGSFCTAASLTAVCLTKGDTFNSTRPNNVFDETFSTTYSGCQRIRS